MGWSFSTAWYNRRTLIEDRIRNQNWISVETGIQSSHKILAYCMRGNNLWKVVESFQYDKDGKQIYHCKWIGLDLLQNGGHSHGWGYKDMDETCGPCQSNCPLAYLEMVKDFPPEGYAINFRERVREYHKLQAKKRQAKAALKTYQPATAKGY